MPATQLYGCLETIKVHLAGSETIFFSVQMWQFWVWDRSQFRNLRNTLWCNSSDPSSLKQELMFFFFSTNEQLAKISEELLLIPAFPLAGFTGLDFMDFFEAHLFSTRLCPLNSFIIRHVLCLINKVGFCFHRNNKKPGTVPVSSSMRPQFASLGTA